MAGFSGGRKSVCPGLVNLETIQIFHGTGFLENPRADAGILEGNPCHQEAFDVARMAGIEFLVNVTVDMQKRITGVFAGHFDKAHAAGVAENQKQLAIDVEREYDIVVSCGGGYPLDTTLYQTIKGMVLATPFVKTGGILVLAASCSEGIGSDDYRQIMFDYSGRWKTFIDDIKKRDYVRKDQWEFEMHVRTLRKIDAEGIHLVTEGIDEDTLLKCSLTPAEGCGQQPAQQIFDRLLQKLANQNPTAHWAVIPTGPYILPRVPAPASVTT
jgi:nickel-dependent lactate racemase